MRQYLDLLRDVRDNGVRKPSRAVLKSTGQNIHTRSLFGRQIRFDLSDGFPIVTTKFIPLRLVAHELIWFLRGETNTAYLTKNNVHIWDEWADDAGELGPVYGLLWRSWPSPDGGTIDQIASVIDGIKATVADPTASVGRRLIVSAWNPAMKPPMAPPACHTLFQFNVIDGRLDCQLYQRSADMFLGVPFNISSYALLTNIISHVVGLKPGEFIHTFGDVHIYENHLEQASEQLSRESFPLPRLAIDVNLKSIDDLTIDHLVLMDYKHHPSLKGEVAI